jgi:2,3-diketo-5-methylthio-1-phosphopentane phosphatase/methylthioribulose-1-phosphate dehydratase
MHTFGWCWIVALIAVCCSRGWTMEDSFFTAAGRRQFYETTRRWITLPTTDTNDDEAGRAAKSLVAQLCEEFYRKGWAVGTSGGIALRIPSQDSYRVFMTPSGLQKENLIGHDIFELDMAGQVVVPPVTPGLKQSASTPLAYVVFEHCPTAMCVMHTHSVYAALASLLPTEKGPGARFPTLTWTQLEMIKGLGKFQNTDVVHLPIIENRPTEDLLSDQFTEVLTMSKTTTALLVQGHGLYVWGDSYQQCQAQLECWEYLCEVLVKMKQLGINTEVRSFRGAAALDNAADCASNAVPLLPRNAKVLLLDIEGCTTSIAFVKEILFPYVLQNVSDYFAHHDDAVQQEAWRQALRRDVQTAAANTGVSPMPPETSDASELIALVTWLTQQDVKSAALKEIQGLMWRAGYQAGTLAGHVYSDVRPALQWMKELGVMVAIFSSGSVAAQKLLFGHSTAGDLLPYLAHHFDINTAGPKKEAASYQAICSALGVSVESIVFVSDSEDELVAARKAGLSHAVISIRPGNAPLTAVGREFPAIYSLLQLCGE